MACRKVVGNAEPKFHSIDIASFNDLSLEAGIPHVPDPAGTASTARIAMDREQRLLGCEDRLRFQSRSKADTYGQCGSSR
jgi:hypothetical protein